MKKHVLMVFGVVLLLCMLSGCTEADEVCGAPMTDEAVEIVMERLEALYDTSN